MKYFLYFAALLMAVVVSATGYLEYQAAYGLGNAKEAKPFVLESGTTVMDLGAALEREGLVSSRYAFAWEVATKRQSRNLIAGDYQLSGTQTIQEILHAFTAGETVSHDVKVTFPEGWTIRLMSERLTKNGLPGEAFFAAAMKPDPKWRAKYAFLADASKGATLEGFLFPDTYRFAPDVSADEIIDTMLANFDKKFTSELRGAAKAKNRTLFEAVTLASIVEEEGRTEKDRGIIADIFWKRLAAGQPFQSDATVNYVLGTLKDQPTLADIETDSPYNTYKYAGLPPGPISNPSLISLKSAVSPTPNPYYYFLNNLETREIFYAETFEGHVANRRAHGL